MSKTSLIAFILLMMVVVFAALWAKENNAYLSFKSATYDCSHGYAKGCDYVKQQPRVICLNSNPDTCLTNPSE